MSVAIPTMPASVNPPSAESASVRRLTTKDAAILFDYQQTHNLSINPLPNLSSPTTLCLLTTPSSGLLIVSLQCTPKPTLHITTLHINPAHRRQGLATIMLDQARTWAGNTIGRCHRRNLKDSRVDVVVEGYENGMEFWDQMGFSGGRGVIQLA